MIFLNVLKEKIFHSFVSGVLICTFILSPISLILGARDASAAMAVHDAAVLGAIQANNGITSSALAKEGLSALFSELIFGSINSETTKEMILDGIAWGLINLVLEEMIQSTTRWVNSGFEGSPAFVTDLNGFLLDLADRVAGEVIWGAGLAFLCSPFKLNVQLALDIQYRETRQFEAQCRLSDVVDNMDAFFNGDFYAGGWDGWFEMTLNPQNNPYGAMLDGQAAVLAGIQNAQGEQINILNWGRGFLSMNDCEVVGIDASGNAQERCGIHTPGVVIETQLNNTLNIPQGRLTVADEINELVGALLTQLTKEVFSSAGGLLGLSRRDSGGRDYFDRARAAATTQANPLSTVSLGSSFDPAIQTETRYLYWMNTFISLITSASTYKDRVYGEDATCHTGNLTTSLQTQLTNYTTAKGQVETILNALKALKADYVALQTPGTPATTVSGILSKYNATSIPAAQGAIMTQFASYSTTITSHTSTNVIYENQTYTALQTEVQEFQTAVQNSCRFNRNGIDLNNIRVPRTN